MSVIEVSNLFVSYGGSPPVVEDISFSVEKSDFLAITGPNGAGKSSLVKAMMGIVPIHSGSVEVAAEYNNCVGYMPQKAYFSTPNFPATVKEVVASGILIKKRFPKRLTTADKVAINEAIGLLQIENLAKRRVGTLSGGEQQRVLLARAFASQPKILILDEPTGALDPHTRGCFYTTLKELNHDRGTTIIMVTHDTHNLGDFAKSMLFIDRSLQYHGSVAGFVESAPKHYFSHKFQEICEECAKLEEL